MKFGRPSELRASLAFTASRRVVGRRSDSTGREYSRVVRVSRSFTNFSARDGGFDGRWRGRNIWWLQPLCGGAGALGAVAGAAGSVARGFRGAAQAA